MGKSDPNRKITTGEFAEILGCKPDTVRKSLCLKGHYLGVQPVKLPNGRLLWPLATTIKIIDGEEIL